MTKTYEHILKQIALQVHKNSKLKWIDYVLGYKVVLGPEIITNGDLLYTLRNSRGEDVYRVISRDLSTDKIYKTFNGSIVSELLAERGI